jgi:hypothetical protein
MALSKDQAVQQASENMLKMMESRKQRGDILIEKWSKFDVTKTSDGTKVLDKLKESNPWKARNVAMGAELQEQYMKEFLTENVISTSFGQSVRPEHLMRVVVIGSANSNRGDIFTEFPIATTDDAIFYVNRNYETAVRGATAGQFIYESTNQYVAGETYTGLVGTGDGATLTFTSAALSPFPHIPFQTRILVNGTQVGADDGSGTIVGATLDTSGTNTTIDATGIITVTFSAGNAPALGAVISAIFNWDSENSNNYTSIGTVSLSVAKKRFDARPVPLGYSFSALTSLVLGTTGLGDARDLLLSAVADEHAKSKDYRAVARARQIGLGNGLATFNADFATAGEVSYKSWAQQILPFIRKQGAVIYDSIKRGQINKIVAGATLSTYLEQHDLWKEDSTQPRIGLYKAGKLSDIDVYTCPADAGLVNTNDMIMTFKNPQEGLDITLVYGVLTEISAALDYPDFYTKGAIAAIEDCLTVNSSFVRVAQVINI